MCRLRGEKHGFAELVSRQKVTSNQQPGKEIALKEKMDTDDDSTSDSDNSTSDSDNSSSGEATMETEDKRYLLLHFPIITKLYRS